MKAKKAITALALALAASGCTQIDRTVDIASRAEPLNGAVIEAETSQTQRLAYDVQDVQIRIPSDLTISEANSFYPLADIVWRGDPLGDRREQVSTILRDSFLAGTESIDGDTPVVVTLTLRRFHSLTERTRYTVGGVHSIKFDLAVTHAETGTLLEGPRYVSADLGGLGGQAAIRADQIGETQKVRIMRHLQMVAFSELRPADASSTDAAPMVLANN